MIPSYVGTDTSDSEQGLDILFDSH